MSDQRRILALSSSRVGNSGYLEKAMPQINSFLGDHPLKIAFVPFAFVDNDPSSLLANVKNAFANTKHTIDTVRAGNGKAIVQHADVIMVSGGNTFKLMHDLYATGLVETIRQKVNAGTPYIGWSAGSNITGATICTTNDMPIIEPVSFKALGFFPFQINPHYYNLVLEGFNGETRDQRLEEFLKINPKVSVIGLPEGVSLLLEKGKLAIVGEEPAVLLKNEDGRFTKTTLEPGSDISHMLSTVS